MENNLFRYKSVDWEVSKDIFNEVELKVPIGMHPKGALFDEAVLNIYDMTLTLNQYHTKFISFSEKFQLEYSIAEQEAQP